MIRHIIKLQILGGIVNARYLFMALFVFVAFTANGIIYSDKIITGGEDWHDQININETNLQDVSGNLQEVSDLIQTVTRPTSMVSFIADDGAIWMPNSLKVNAFGVNEMERLNRSNEEVPLVPAMDWAFIAGYLMSLMAILLSYDAVCGEKDQGTLRLILTNPVSRLSLFLGKYLGLLITLLITFIVGGMVSTSILVFNEAVVLDADVLTVLGWTVVFVALFLSFMVLISIVISSLVKRPSVALILLAMIWVVTFVAVPGIARLVSEQTVHIQTPYEITAEIDRQKIEIWENAPEGAGNFSGDPFDWFMPDRARMMEERTDAEQRIILDTLEKKILQIRNLQLYSLVSPHSLLTGSLQSFCNTGHFGFEDLVDKAVEYRDSLKEFIISRDRLDTTSAHLVYGADGKSERQTFSTQEVDTSTIPRWSTLWKSSGLALHDRMPWLQFVLLLAANINLATLAIMALFRYDPR